METFYFKWHKDTDNYNDKNTVNHTLVLEFLRVLSTIEEYSTYY